MPVKMLSFNRSAVSNDALKIFKHEFRSVLHLMIELDGELMIYFHAGSIAQEGQLIGRIKELIKM
ncbi:hypothetical protein [Persicobacter psychrovividus]